MIWTATAKEKTNKSQHPQIGCEEALFKSAAQEALRKRHFDRGPRKRRCTRVAVGDNSMGEQIDSSPDFLFRPLLGEKTMRGIVGEKTMRKVILTNEQNGSMNSNAHRVVSDGRHPTAEEVRPTTAELQASTLEELRLFTASEAARILHVSRNAIYALWRDGQLDFWRINGTMTTNLTAIRDFLERTKNGELAIDRAGDK